MSCVFSFCSGFLPTQWFIEETDAFDLFKDSVLLLEERLAKLSAELLYSIRNGETNFFSGSCLEWERRAAAHESKCGSSVQPSSESWGNCTSFFIQRSPMYLQKSMFSIWLPHSFYLSALLLVVCAVCSNKRRKTAELLHPEGLWCRQLKN